MEPKFTYIKSKPDPRDYIYSAKVTFDPTQIPSRYVLNDPITYDTQVIGDCGGESGRSAYGIYLQGKIDVSPDFLYEEAKKLDGMPNAEGTTPKAIVSVMKNVGACERSLYPTLTSPFNMPNPSQDTFKSAANYKISQYMKIQSLDELKHAIASGNPVLIALLCCQNFVDSEGGFVNTPQGAILGGHLLCGKGYDDNLTHTYADGTTRTGFVKGKNSWGKDWGDNGDVWIPYDFFNFYLQDEMQYAVMEMWTITPDFQAVKPKNVITLRNGDLNATVNGQTVALDVAPVIVNGRLMVPIRFVGEQLGVNVDYSETTGEVTITEY